MLSGEPQLLFGGAIGRQLVSHEYARSKALLLQQFAYELES